MEKSVIMLVLFVLVGNVCAYNSSLVDPNDTLVYSEIPARFLDNFIFTLISEEGNLSYLGSFVFLLLALVIIYLPVRALRGGR